VPTGYAGLDAWTKGLEALKSLADERMRRTTPAAIKSLYRQFMDLEPVWTGMLVFNYNFYIGSAPSGTISNEGTGVQVPRTPAIAAALQGYMNDVPKQLPAHDGVYWIVNQMDYAWRIETEGSPKGYGQHALAYAANNWAAHVKLGLAEAEEWM
jgi:hypothetical protein